MILGYKPDFDRAKRQWSLFWKGENRRPLVNIVVSKQGVKPIDAPRYLSGRDGNFRPVIDQWLAYFETHEFIGEAMPYIPVEWGPDTFSSFLGADLKFFPEGNPYTSWCQPFVTDWDEAELRFRRDGYWWQMTLEYFGELKRQFDGKALINPPTILANLDALAAVRGPENILVDILECPEKVKTALEKVNRVHDEVLGEYAKVLEFDKYGSMGVEATYCDGIHSRPQCDISCMLGVDMFGEFVLPSLEHEFGVQDAGVYHLDGSGAIRHLESLCSIGRLDVICWVPSAGNDQEKDWFHLFEKIDGLGKGQVFWGLDYETVKLMWEEFKSRKLFFKGTMGSRAEAEDLIAKLENLG